MQGTPATSSATPDALTASRRGHGRWTIVVLVGALVWLAGAVGCDGQKGQGASEPTEVAAADGTESPAPTPAAKPEAADTESAEAEQADAATEGAPEKPPEPPPAPTEPQTILILGDSLAATGFGVILAKRLDAHPMVTTYRKGKSASGLARPDFFDWMAEGRRQVDLREPDVVVVIMGGNDGQDLTTVNGKGRRVRWDSKEWSTAYGERMMAFLQEISAPGRKVVWLGLPKMGMNSLERKLLKIREIQAAQLAKMDDAGLYLETTPHLVDENGELLRLARVRGKNLTVREDDGIHFTMSGSQYLADRVYPEILEAMGLTPVQDEG